MHSLSLIANCVPIIDILKPSGSAAFELFKTFLIQLVALLALSKLD